MKKIIALAVIIISLSSFSNNTQAQVKYGLGLNFGTYLNNPGINARIDARIFDNFSIVPMVDISVPKFRSGLFLNSASLHVHYHIEILEELTVYPLAGLTAKSYINLDRAGYDRLYHDLIFNPSGGAGAEFRINRDFYLFAESRLEIGRRDQLVMIAGFLIRP